MFFQRREEKKRNGAKNHPCFSIQNVALSTFSVKNFGRARGGRCRKSREGIAETLFTSAICCRCLFAADRKFYPKWWMRPKYHRPFATRQNTFVGRIAFKIESVKIYSGNCCSGAVAPVEVSHFASRGLYPIMRLGIIESIGACRFHCPLIVRRKGLF